MKLFGGNGKKNREQSREQPPTSSSRSEQEPERPKRPVRRDPSEFAAENARLNNRVGRGEGNVNRPDPGVTGDDGSKTHGGKKRGRTPLIVLSAVVLLIIIVVGAYALWVKPPEIDSGDLTRPTPPGTVSSPNLRDNDGDNAQSTSSHKPNTYTFLVVGQDKGGANTDTIMVGMFDIDGKELNIISIPRDTIANIGPTAGTKRVNGIYSLSYSQAIREGKTTAEADAIASEALIQGIRDIIGYSVDCFAVVDLEAFIKLVDAMDGVEFNVPQRMYWVDVDPNLTIDLNAGLQKLDGKQALQLVRFRRYTYGDIDRIAVQQDFLKAVAKQLLTVNSIPKIGEYADIFKEYVYTDLKAENIAFFGQEMLKISTENIHFYTLPHDILEEIQGNSYVSVRVDEWLELLNASFNPFSDIEIERAHLNIMTYDGGVYESTSGVNRDPAYFSPIR